MTHYTCVPDCFLLGQFPWTFAKRIAGTPGAPAVTRKVLSHQ